MKRSTNNPWIGAGLVAGVAVAVALALVWPSPAKVSQKAHVTASKEAEPTFDACRLCQQDRCELTANACYPPKDGKSLTWPPADAGGPPSAEDQAGCRQLYECFRKTHCADLDPGVCYCGAGVDAEKCFAGEAPPTGPCKELVEVQAKTKDPRAISLRYSDPRYPLGLAEFLRLCSATFCRDACR
jgi:hypothetical protein